ncbi:ribosome hibernation-promoting factor, HPF/YfiA family [Microvirga subterranea]|uniref:Ribosomal subunit interface protein n=1 Tax=Microvirga subterranea TaxID=186651 RepID=A0A370HS98_9HYPH|nr:ribosome-associated translation inhibitor RaiA [Microvirga subterranea]RDI61170.1 ribosomal subunit interface protein [Microvirga subterranea]
MDLEGLQNAITIESSSVDLSDAFREHAQQGITRVAGKYFGHLNTASVHVGREGIYFRCTVNIQMGALKMMSAEAQDKDCYLAFKIALEKVEKQLRRAKRELREDKAVRLDKDLTIREGMRPEPSA